MTTEPLAIAIVGAGISGLATALFFRRQLSADKATINIYEASPTLTEAGAGIQIPPNASRLLARCGVFVGKDGVKTSGELEPATVTYRRYEDGNVLRVSRVGGARALYKAPYLVIHRADYQKALYEAVARAGVQINFSSAVQSVEATESTRKPLSLHLASSTVPIAADLIIGADGIGSTIRHFVPRSDHMESTGPTHCVYRALVSAASMTGAGEEVAKLISNPESTCWLGPNRHVVAYPIRNASLYNIVLVNAASDGPYIEQTDRTWDHVIPADAVRACFAQFEPRVRSILNLARDFRGWTLREGPSPRRWAHRGVVLVGDAAHAMFPYMGQGAAQAVEDAAVLALCIRRGLEESKPLSECLEAYEALRRPRAERVVATSRQNGDINHLVDGECQQKRDAAFSRSQAPPLSMPANPLPAPPPAEVGSADPRFIAWLFGLDVEAEAGNKLDAIFKEISVRAAKTSPKAVA